MDPKQQIDLAMALLTARERQLIEEGKTKEEAEELACAEILREIRNS